VPPANQNSGQEWHARVKPFAEISQSVLTIAGILAAGIWFLLQQQCGPKIKIEHKVSHRESAADPSQYLVGVDVFLSNIGSVAVTLTCGHLKVLNVNPGNADGDPEYLWGGTDKDPRCLEQRFIEPNGTDQVHEEISVDRSVKTLRIHSFFANPTVRNKDGWELITLYDLDPGQHTDTSVPPGRAPSSPGKKTKGP